MTNTYEATIAHFFCGSGGGGLGSARARDDSEATPCGCVAADFGSIPAVPVEVEQRRAAGERRCLMCGTSWRVGPDMWTPIDVQKAAAA
jgi:hypothetical protein